MVIGNMVYIVLLNRNVVFNVISSEEHNGEIYFKAVNSVSGDCIKFREIDIGNTVFMVTGGI